METVNQGDISAIGYCFGGGIVLEMARRGMDLDAAGVNCSFINLAGAKHSFANPDADEYAQRFNIPLAYSSEADKRSWEEVQQVLGEIYNR